MNILEFWVGFDNSHEAAVYGYGVGYAWIDDIQVAWNAYFGISFFSGGRSFS